MCLLISKAYDPIVNLVANASQIKPMIEKQAPFLKKSHLLAFVWFLSSVLAQYTGFFEPLMMNAGQHHQYTLFCKKGYNDHMMIAQYYKAEGYLDWAKKLEAGYVRM